MGEEGGAERVSASGGASDSAASSLPGVGVDGSLSLQESLVLAAPSSVASSVSAESGRRSRSRKIGESTEVRTAPAHALRGLGSRVTYRASRALVPRTVRGLVDEVALAEIRHAHLLPACGLRGSGHGLRPATGPVEFDRTLGVTVRGLDECARVRLAVTRPGMTSCSHTTGRVAVASHRTVHPFPLTVRGLGGGVGSLGHRDRSEAVVAS